MYARWPLNLGMTCKPLNHGMTRKPLTAAACACRQKKTPAPAAGGTLDTPDTGAHVAGSRRKARGGGGGGGKRRAKGAGTGGGAGEGAPEDKQGEEKVRHFSSSLTGREASRGEMSHARQRVSRSEREAESTSRGSEGCDRDHVITWLCRDHVALS